MHYLLLLFFLIFYCSTSQAISPEEELKKVQEKLNEQKKKLNEAHKQESSILGEIENVNTQLNMIEKDLIKYRLSLRQTEKEISNLNSEIENTRTKLRRQKDWLRRRLRSIQKANYSGDALVLILSTEDVSKIMRTLKYLEKISRYEYKVLSDYKENLKILEEKKEKMQVLRDELKKKEAKVKSKEEEYIEKRREKEKILTRVRYEKEAHQKMLNELKEASKRLMDMIRESSRRDDYVASGFGRLKGKLLWPTDGRIAIPYGSQKDPQFNTLVFRNGIHIQTESGADARAVFGGKIIFAEWFKGFGKIVIINHGSGYHTLYGNLSEIFTRVGDIIKENHVIGKVGTSGLLNAPGLYFEIRYKGKPLDPAQWLISKRK